MDKIDCQKEKLSARTVGLMIVIVSLLLLTVGWVLLPVVGFIFSLPLLVLGVGMITAPESKTCRLIMEGFRGR